MKYVKKHIKWDYYPVGSRGKSIRAEEADETIEEIISILRKKVITVKVAKQILEDTISAIDNEAKLDEML